MNGIKLLLGLLVTFVAFTAGSAINTKCHTTANCADSGTICKTSSHDTASDQSQDSTDNDDQSNDAFDPLTSDEADVSDDDDSQEFSDEVLQADVSAAIATPTDDPKKVVLKKGVKATPSKTDTATGEVKIGSPMIVNGFKCVITGISNNKDSKIKDVAASLDFLQDYDGSFVPDQQDAAESDEDAVDDPSKLSIGKTVRLGPVSCKITEKTKSTSASSGGGEVTKKPIATAKPTAAAANPEATKKPTVKRTTVPKPMSPKIPASSLGTCVCDESKRFACTTNDDCFARFQDKTIICFSTQSCKTDLGTGFCRRKGPEVDDEASPSA